MLERRSEKKSSGAAFFSIWGRDLSLQWLSTIYVAAVSFGVSVVLARELGVEGFGTYSYLLSLAGIFVILQDGGYKMLLFREGVDGSGGRLLSSGIGHLVLMTLAGGLVVLLLQPQEWQALLGAVLCMALVVLSEFVSSGLKGEGKFRLDALWKVVVRSAVGTSILYVVILHETNTPAQIFFGWSMGLLVVMIWPLFKGWLRWPVFRFRTDLVKSSIAFLTIDLATILYFRSDIVLLKYFGQEPQDVGQYAAAYRVLEGIILLATPVAQIAFRNLRLRWLQESGFLRLFLVLLLAMFMAAVGILIVGVTWGRPFMVLIFGEAYGIAGDLLFWLLLSILFILPNYILTQGAIAIDKEKGYAWAAIGAALVNVALNLFWIPKYGAVGAAWATIAAEGVLFIGLGWIFWRGWKKSKSFQQNWKSPV